MATRIRVPWVLDVVLVSEPSEIRALDDEPLIDRRFIPRGPLVNRCGPYRKRPRFRTMRCSRAVSRRPNRF